MTLFIPENPSDVSVSEKCIDANLDGIQTTFPVSRRRNGARGQYPKLPLINTFTNVILTCFIMIQREHLTITYDPVH